MLGGPEHAGPHPWQKTKTAEWDAFAACQDAARWLGQTEMDGRQLPTYAFLERPKPRLVIAEEKEVIRIAEISPVAFRLGQRVIKRVEVKVAPKLAGEVAVWCHASLPVCAANRGCLWVKRSDEVKTTPSDGENDRWF